MGRHSRGFDGFYRAIKADIYKFCEAFNFVPTAQQRLVLDAVQAAQDGKGPRRIAVKSGQGPGKTTCSGIAALWRTIQDVGALTVVTAPTMCQCKEIWLVEARRQLANADPLLQKLIKITKSRIVVGGIDEWGVKLVTATRAEAAQGFHQKKLTFIAEEASGIPRELVTQIKGTLSNPNAMFLMIGNPNTRDCSFFDCFNSQRDEWKTITLNAEETPESEWFSQQRNADLAREFGRESDVYRVRVLGEFPHSDPNCVMSSEDLTYCATKTSLYECALMRRWTQPAKGPAKQFGVDFARFGSDESTVYQRSGNAIVEWAAFAKTEPSVVADFAMKLQVESSWRNDECWFVPDAGGMGQGVIHRFYQHDEKDKTGKRQVLEFHNGGTSSDSQYANKITEAWFNLAKLVKNKECRIPNDNRLIQQLSTRQYYTNAKGKLILETKDEYMKRGFDSPDRADGIVTSFYDHLSVSAEIAQKPAGRQIGAKVRM